VSVVTTEKADADSLSDAPLRDTRANRFDAPCHLVPRHSRKTQTWKLTLDGERVGMTNAASFNPDQNLSFVGLGYRSFNDLKITGRRDFDCFECFCHFRLAG
jgi:hypothetical protein